jgi:hypothetical protein
MKKPAFNNKECSNIYIYRERIGDLGGVERK